ncbi:MAG: ABC transporter ATP-binding protein [Cyanobacteria bacterium P01_D01_bin.1]
MLLPNRSYGEDFWALKGLTLTIPKGEATGIIGRNGAGKSTLLKIIAGTLSPTTGEVLVNGQVAALLELGSGFNPEFTGNDNIFLNCKLLGLSTAQVHEKLDSIIKFSEIGDFLDQPVKTYSSGMKTRLAFSVCVAIEPEILIIDEALSVGDIFFRQKCFQRMEDLLSQNKTVLFVSHNLPIVKNFCKTAYFLENGEIYFYGPSSEAIGKFNSIQNSPQAEGKKDTLNKIVKENNKRASSDNNPTNQSLQKATSITANAIWKAPNDNITDSKAKVLAVSILDNLRIPTMSCQVGDSLLVRAYVTTGILNGLHVGIALKNQYNRFVFRGGSYFSGQAPLAAKNGEIQCFEMALRMNIEAGIYTMMVSLDHPKAAPNGINRISSSSWLGPVEVRWDYRTQRAPFLGMVGLPYEGKLAPFPDIDS